MDYGDVNEYDANQLMALCTRVPPGRLLERRVLGNLRAQFCSPRTFRRLSDLETTLNTYVHCVRLRSIKMLRLLGLLILLHFATGSLNTSVLFQEVIAYQNATYYKADYAYEVVSKIYNAFRRWFFTITFCEFTYFENRILKYTETTGYGYPVILLNGCPDTNRTRVKPKINKHGQTAYVITGNDISLDISEYVVDALIRTGVFKPRSAVIFIINEPIEMDSYFFYTLKCHFQFLWSKSITNSVVILKWEQTVKTFTYNSFKDELMDITDVKNITYLLYHQYDNLLGHVLRLSVYKKISNYDEDEPINCKSRLASNIMHRLNASCKPVAPRDGNTVGDLLDNGTATGVTADLMDGYTDLELSSRILKNSYYGYIDTTYPLMRDELCFMLKSADKQSTFTTILQLISVTTFIIFMFNVIFMTSVTVIVRKIEINIWNLKKQTPTGHIIMDLVKCFTKQTVNLHKKRPVFRIMVLTIVVYSLIVNCLIEGIITSAITYPRYRSKVNTLDELFDSNLTLGVHNRYIEIFNASLTHSAREKLKTRIETINDKKIVEIIEERNFQYALLLRKSDAISVTQKVKNMAHDRPIFQVMQECPIPCFIVYGLRYGSPYLRKIENTLHHLNQGGIMNFWLKVEEYNIKRNIFNTDDKYLKPLSLANLRSVFIVWSIGLALSTVSFLLEILIYRWCEKVHNLI
ncbi:unnamed protein product [Diatraea saccharalis]|uniref:Ionotropic receptor n=1 Tax=Diatraea saccharalis TaxID=40085 RepID=A0A9N9R1S9_9NEOP|nr:unnamed protein product [Diatraea saccharalis]